MNVVGPAGRQLPCWLIPRGMVDSLTRYERPCPHHILVMTLPCVGARGGGGDLTGRRSGGEVQQRTRFGTYESRPVKSVQLCHGINLYKFFDFVNREFHIYTKTLQQLAIPHDLS